MIKMSTTVLWLFGATFALTATHATAANPTPGASPVPSITPGGVAAGAGLVALPTIALECSGAGHSDVTSKNHTIKNATGHTVPSGTKLHWTSSDKKSGSLTLTADLPNGKDVSVIEPGGTNGYTCEASFHPSADISVTRAKWISPTQAYVEVSNVSPWVDAGAFVVHFQSFKCLSTQLGTINGNALPLPKGAIAGVTVNFPRGQADYLQATANVTNTVSEINKENNVTKSAEFLTNKSCTPQ